MSFTYFNFPFFAKETTEPNFDKKDLRQTIFIISEDDATDENISFLKKIIQSIHLDPLKDCTLFVVNKEKRSALLDLLDSSKAYKIVIFGIRASKLSIPIETRVYECIPIQHIQFLFVHPLKQLIQNVSYKKDLWTQLKALYDIA